MKKFLVILMVLAMTSFIFVGCLPTTNTAPVFTSTPGTTATVGTAYSYTATATDADADTVTFSVAGPTGMAISGAVITWTPTTAQIGTHSVVVTASDGTNATAQTATITVSAAAVTGTIVSIPGILGVTAPVYGATPVEEVDDATQYTGTVAWETAAGVAVGTTFAAETVYVATITLIPVAGFTFTGVTANFFEVPTAEGASNPANSGTVTATFAETEEGGAVVSIEGILGVTAPVYGEEPVEEVDDATQYTGTVAWETAAGVAVGTTFAAETVYVATITLIPVAGFTFTGVTANFFEVPTAEGASNPANSGTVTATFAETGEADDTVPTVVSCIFTDSDTITIVYSEAVDSTLADYAGTTEITYPTPERVLTPIIVYGTGTDTISIDFTSVPSGVGFPATGITTGTIDIAATVLASVGKQPLVALTDHPITAGNF